MYGGALIKSVKPTDIGGTGPLSYEYGHIGGRCRAARVYDPNACT